MDMGSADACGNLRIQRMEMPEGITLQARPEREGGPPQAVGGFSPENLSVNLIFLNLTSGIFKREQTVS